MPSLSQLSLPLSTSSTANRMLVYRKFYESISESLWSGSQSIGHVY